MPTPERQLARAARAVAARIDELGMTVPRAARAAGVHPNTLRRFVKGEHWPARATLAKLNKALAWPPGEISRMAVATDGEATGLEVYPTDALIMELCRRLNGSHAGK